MVQVLHIVHFPTTFLLMEFFALDIYFVAALRLVWVVILRVGIPFRYWRIHQNSDGVYQTEEVSLPGLKFNGEMKKARREAFYN